MTLFGKSLFETVLAGIDARKQEEETEDATEPVIRGLNAGFVGRDFHRDHIMEADPAAQFESFLDGTGAITQESGPGQEPARPFWLDRLTEAEIAEDIGLRDGLSRQQLQEMRRRFARDNHPDCVASQYQAIATLRMMAANQLIDSALKAAKS